MAGILAVDHSAPTEAAPKGAVIAGVYERLMAAYGAAGVVACRLAVRDDRGGDPGAGGGVAERRRNDGQAQGGRRALPRRAAAHPGDGTSPALLLVRLPQRQGAEAEGFSRSVSASTATTSRRGWRGRWRKSARTCFRPMASAPRRRDSILLYAAGRPVFVIDAMTRRIVDRLGIAPTQRTYGGYQRLFAANLPAGNGGVQRVPRPARGARQAALREAGAPLRRAVRSPSCAPRAERARTYNRFWGDDFPEAARSHAPLRPRPARLRPYPQRLRLRLRDEPRPASSASLGGRCCSCGSRCTGSCSPSTPSGTPISTCTTR